MFWYPLAQEVLFDWHNCVMSSVTVLACLNIDNNPIISLLINKLSTCNRKANNWHQWDCGKHLKGIRKLNLLWCHIKGKFHLARDAPISLILGDPILADI